MKISKISFFLLIAASVAPLAQAEQPHSESPSSQYRGWDFVVERLRQDGVKEELIQKVYADPRMPEFSFIGFGVRPRESANLYRGFTKKGRIDATRIFLNEHDAEFDEVEERFGVNRYVIAAIILIESELGRVTGRELVINRLSRLVGAATPTNIVENFTRLKKTDKKVTLKQVEQRAKYLHTTFFPELPAFFTLIEKTGADPFEVLGSSAGAFGIPQFLPSAYIKYGIDANKDGKVSLFLPADAIHSTANFLKANGWDERSATKAKRNVLWQYNRSDAYIDSVLKVADTLRPVTPKAPKILRAAAKPRRLPPMQKM